MAVLASLSSSFKAVGSQTTAFQAQCEDVLADQRRLKTLSDEVGTDLQYYGYLEPITRRLNAPGASRMLGDDSLVEMLTSLNACIEFMISHVSRFVARFIVKIRFSVHILSGLRDSTLLTIL